MTQVFEQRRNGSEAQGLHDRIPLIKARVRG
jgi:hypothetical protein